MRHLFLEGPVRSGKSTLIRECLTPYRDEIGGFCCVRLIDDAGDIVGYRLAPAYHVTVDERYSAAAKNVFIEFGDDAHCPKDAEGLCGSGTHTVTKHLDVFDDASASYLKDTKGKQLMLLDEIGGFELKSEAFKNALYDLLGSGIPCIGVLKGARTPSAPEENAKLKIDLKTRFDAEIIQYSPEDRAAIKGRIDDFLESILCRDRPAL